MRKLQIHGALLSHRRKTGEAAMWGKLSLLKMACNRVCVLCCEGDPVACADLYNSGKFRRDRRGLPF